MGEKIYLLTPGFIAFEGWPARLPVGSVFILPISEKAGAQLR